MAVVAGLGCGGGTHQVGALRFANRAPVWRVNDRESIPQPEPIPFRRLVYYVDQILYRGPAKALAVERTQPASGVNALDEVPDSTWYTNRITTGGLMPEDVARGPNTTDGPDRRAPWSVVGTKQGGAQLGFRIRDARGTTFILKFDRKGRPEAESASDVVAQRLLWALGYQVPEDSVVVFSRNELVVAETAKLELADGSKRPMTEVDLTEMLRTVDRDEHGRLRGLASKFLSGKPLGGYPQLGTRGDDPNDTIPHQHRRDQRALYLFYSWLQSTDVKTDNTLDMWVEDPARPGHHYVVHYLVDLGMSLGVNGYRGNYGDGFIHNFDFGNMFPSALTFGLWRRPWENMVEPGIRGVGTFDVEHYDPSAFKTRTPYFIFDYVDRHDMLWAAKALLLLTPAHIRAAVEQGRYSERRAVDYLTQVLIGRQRKAARYWLERTNPLAGFAVAGGGSLCFDDLLLRYELGARGAAAGTAYRARTFGGDGRPLGDAAGVAAGAAGRACAEGLRVGDAADRYTIVRIDTRRGANELPPVFVHLAAAPEGGLRIIGIDRR